MLVSHLCIKFSPDSAHHKNRSNSSFVLCEQIPTLHIQRFKNWNCCIKRHKKIGQYSFSCFWFLIFIVELFQSIKLHKKIGQYSFSCFWFLIFIVELFQSIKLHKKIGQYSFSCFWFLIFIVELFQSIKLHKKIGQYSFSCFWFLIFIVELFQGYDRVAYDLHRVSIE